MGIASTTTDELSDEDFQELRRSAKEIFGITIVDEKRPLAESRLRSLSRRMGGTPLSTLVRSLARGDNRAAASEVVDALTTNHTYFGREAKHFDILREQALPPILKALAGRRDLRIWCAAAATGEEPYYLAMLLMDHLGSEYSSWRAGLLATDISENALSVARAGVYTAERVEPLGESYRRRFFDELPDGRYRVKQEVKDEVSFRRFNLMSDPYPFSQPFEVIFCRNVMIYFERPEMEHVLDRMAGLLKPGGWFFTGMAESLRRDDPRFEYLETGVYRRR